MITKGTIVAWGIVFIIITHKVLRDFLFPSLLYVFALSLILFGLYYLSFGWFVYAIIYALGGAILLTTLWKI